MENLGTLAILLAFCFAIYAVIGSVAGKLGRRPFLGMVLLALVPAVIATFVNIAYNHIRIITHLTVEQQAGRLNIRNTTLVGDYDKFYQNVFAGGAAPASPRA